MASAFTLFGDLKLDTRSFANSLRDSENRLKTTETAIVSTEKRVQSLGVTTSVSGRSFDRLNEKLNEARQRLAVTSEAFSKGEASQNQMRSALLGVEKATAQVNSALANASAKAEDFANRQAAAAQKAAIAQQNAAQKAADAIEKEQQRAAAAAERAAQQAATAWQRFGNGLSGIGRSLQGLGTSLTLAVTAPIGLATKSLLSAGADYETALNTFQAVTTATADEMTRAQKAARDLGADLTLPATSAKDAALAMVELGKAGLNANQSIAASKGVLQLAAAGQIDEARAAEIAANALNAFHLQASESTKVADLLAAAANASSAEIDDIALAMQQASAVFAAAKIPIEDLITSISLMANAGVKGSDAGTSLKVFLERLQAPTSKAADVMQALGISVFDAQGKMRPLIDIIGQFNRVFATMTDEKKTQALAQIFGTDAIRAAQILFSAGETGFQQIESAVTKVGAASDLAAAKTKGLAGAWDNLKSQLETIGIDIYNAVKEPLTDLLREAGAVIGQLGEAFNNLSPTVQKAVIAIAALAAAAGPALVILGSAVVAVGALVNGIALAATAVGGLGALLSTIGVGLAVIAGLVAGLAAPVTALIAESYVLLAAWQSNFGGIRDVTAQVWEQIKATVQAGMDLVSGVVKTVLGAIQQFWTDHGSAVMAYLQAWWNAAAQFITGAIKIIGDVISLALQVIRGDWEGAWKSILDLVKTAFATLVGYVVNLGSVLRTLLAAILPMFGDFALALTRLTIQAVVGVVSILANLPRYIVQLVPKLIVAGAQLGQAIWDGIKQGMRDALFGSADNSTIDLGSPKDFVQNIINELTSKFSGTGQFAFAGGSVGIGGNNVFDQINNSAKNLMPTLDKVDDKLKKVTDDVQASVKVPTVDASNAAKNAVQKVTAEIKPDDELKQLFKQLFNPTLPVTLSQADISATITPHLSATVQQAVEKDSQDKKLSTTLDTLGTINSKLIDAVRQGAIVHVLNDAPDSARTETRPTSATSNNYYSNH